jgi:Tol biopolymer transport system component
MRTRTISTVALLGAGFLFGCSDQPTSPLASSSEPALDGSEDWDDDDDGSGGATIAFGSNRTGFYNVFVMRPDGRRERQLTDQPNYNARPNWSPSGRRITFTACRWYDSSCDVYVMNADGTDQVNLTAMTNPFSTDEMSVWSPNGRRIAFKSDRDGNSEIYVMNADGTNPTRLTYNEARDVSPSWSPDGRKITFESTRDGNSEVYVMNADGSNQVNISRNPEAADFNPAWSPRGDRIAFVSNRDDPGNFDIYVMTPRGRDQTRLTSDPAFDYYPAWSPSANRIAFASNRAPEFNFDIWVMRANGSRETRVTDNPADDVDPAWARGAADHDD